MFLTEEELEITNEYLKNGYAIRPVADRGALDRIRETLGSIVRDILKSDVEESTEDLLNNVHTKVSVENLNHFRLKVIHGINAIPTFRRDYFLLAKPFIEMLVGNELAMQLRVNLSIQFPHDSSSLLPVHSDTWSGDSPFEIVVWLPLVDCYSTKSMYLLPPGPAKAVIANFKNLAGQNSEDLYQSISTNVNFLNIKYGEVLLFDQGLPHGNRINLEAQTRWSMNCRFKGVFTPYGDKKIGEFFEPITLRGASQAGMNYRFPRVDHERN